MNEIIPAVIAENFADLGNHLSRVAKLVKTVQIDVMDGSIAGRSSWPYKKADTSFEKILEESEGMPFWDILNYEIHLMLDKPEEKIEDWVRAGATRIIIHPETTRSFDSIIETYSEALEIGIAIGLDVPLAQIASYLEKVKTLQFMGIKHIGYQGEPFDRNVLGKIHELRSSYPNHIISVDGGVTLENAKSILDAGANRLVVGSTIFNAPNIAEMVRLLENI